MTPEARRPLLPTVSGCAVAATGLGLVGIGAWARRDVRRELARQRVSAPPALAAGGGPVASAPAARALAELIRDRTLEASGGRTYAETDPYVTADGATTSDPAAALTDKRTGQPLANPEVELWITSTALQTALMQAYLAFRLADLTAGLGAALVCAGAGIAAAGRR